MLFEAVGKNDVEAVKSILKDKKINVNIQYKHGYTVLITASEKNHIEIVKLLLESSNKTNLDVNIQNLVGNTALIEASSQGHVEIVKLLLENPEKTNIDVNIKNYLGNTALRSSSLKEHNKIIKLLLRYRNTKLYNVIEYYQIKEILRIHFINPSNFWRQPKKEVKYYDKRF